MSKTRWLVLFSIIAFLALTTSAYANQCQIQICEGSKCKYGKTHVTESWLECYEKAIKVSRSLTFALHREFLLEGFAETNLIYAYWNFDGVWGYVNELTEVYDLENAQPGNRVYDYSGKITDPTLHRINTLLPFHKNDPCVVSKGTAIHFAGPCLNLKYAHPHRLGKWVNAENWEALFSGS